MSSRGSETGRFNRVPRVATIAGLVALGVLIFGVVRNPPLQSIGDHEIGLRLNRLTGNTSELHEGVALVLPGVHRLRVYSLEIGRAHV